MPDTTMLGADRSAMLGGDLRMAESGLGAGVADGPAGAPGAFRRVLDESVAAANEADAATAGSPDVDGAGEDRGGAEAAQPWAPRSAGAGGPREPVEPDTERSLAPPPGAHDAPVAVETAPASGSAGGAERAARSQEAPRDLGAAKVGTLPSPAPEDGSDGAGEVVFATGIHLAGADRLAADHLREAAEKARLGEEGLSGPEVDSAEGERGGPGEGGSAAPPNGRGALGAAAERASGSTGVAEDTGGDPGAGGSVEAGARPGPGATNRPVHGASGQGLSGAEQAGEPRAADRAGGHENASDGAEGARPGPGRKASRKAGAETTSGAREGLGNDAAAQAAGQAAAQAAGRAASPGTAPSAGAAEERSGAFGGARAAGDWQARGTPGGVSATATGPRAGAASAGPAVGRARGAWSAAFHGDPAPAGEAGGAAWQGEPSPDGGGVPFDPRSPSNEPADARPARLDAPDGAANAARRPSLAGEPGDSGGATAGQAARGRPRSPDGAASGLDSPGNIAPRRGTAAGDTAGPGAAGAAPRPWRSPDTGTLEQAPSGTAVARSVGTDPRDRSGGRAAGSPEETLRAGDKASPAAALGGSSRGELGPNGEPPAPGDPRDMDAARGIARSASAAARAAPPATRPATGTAHEVSRDATLAGAASGGPMPFGGGPMPFGATGDTPPAAGTTGGARAPSAGPEDLAAPRAPTADPAVGPGDRAPSRGRLAGPAILFPNAESRQAAANRAALAAGAGRAAAGASPASRVASPLQPTDAQIRGTLDASAGRPEAASVPVRRVTTRPTGRFVIDREAPPIGTAAEIERAFAADDRKATSAGPAPEPPPVQLADILAPDVPAPFGTKAAASPLGRGNAREMRAVAERLARSAETASGANSAFAGPRAPTLPPAAKPGWAGDRPERPVPARAAAPNDSGDPRGAAPAAPARPAPATGLEDRRRTPLSAAVPPTSLSAADAARSGPTPLGALDKGAGLPSSVGRAGQSRAGQSAPPAAPTLATKGPAAPASTGVPLAATATLPLPATASREVASSAPAGLSSFAATPGVAPRGVPGANTASPGDPQERLSPPDREHAPPRRAAPGDSPFPAGAASNTAGAAERPAVPATPASAADGAPDSLPRAPISAASGWSPDTQRDPPAVPGAHVAPADGGAPDELRPRARSPLGATAHDPDATGASTPHLAGENGAPHNLSPSGPTLENRAPEPLPATPANLLSRLEERMVERRQRVAAGGLRGPSPFRGTHAEAQIPDFGRISVDAVPRGSEVDVRVTAHEADAARALREARPALETHLRDGAVPLGHLSLGDSTSGGAAHHGPGGDRQTQPHDPPATPPQDSPRPTLPQRPGARVRVVL